MNLVVILLSISTIVSSQISVDKAGNSAVKGENAAKEVKATAPVINQKDEDEKLIKQVFGDINKAAEDKVIKGQTGKGFAVVEETAKVEKDKKTDQVIKNEKVTQEKMKDNAVKEKKISEVSKGLEEKAKDKVNEKKVSSDIIKSGNEAVNKDVASPDSNVISLQEYLPMYSLQMIPPSLYPQQSWYL